MIAQGLAQAAAIASKPIPQYYKGRAGGPAEWALVGDRGAELVSGRSGGAQLFEKPTITYLKKDDVVHTAAETSRILAGNNVLQSHLDQRKYLGVLRGQSSELQKRQAQTYDASGMLRTVAQASRHDADRVIGAINRIAERPEWRFTEDGWRLFTRRGDHVTEHVNRFFKRHG